MCGIVGILNVTNENSIISTMAKKMSLRGPDDFGIYNDAENKIQLGQTRLSIIDLSKNGHQPMHYLNDKYTIVFNGEIYNFGLIKSTLQDYGYHFNTQSDTEVILAAYDFWGSKCCSMFNGMFAFAIWNKEAKELFLARDRFGIKPLLYSANSRYFLFASEIKAILASNIIPRIVNKNSVLDLFLYGSVMQPKTIIENVFSLLPGHYMKIDCNNNFQTFQYYNLKENVELLKQEIRNLDYSDLVSILRMKLEESVRLNLVSDVKVGTFLSSGIDSMAISALMAKYSNTKLNSFTVGYEQSGSLKSELENVRLVSNYFDYEHTEILINPEDLKQNFSQIIYAMDQPSYDGINVYFVSKFASKKVKVAISGLGGDELFAGYPHFAYLLEASKRKPFLWDTILDFIGQLRPNKFSTISTYRRRTITKNFSSLRKIFPRDEINKIFNREFVNEYDPNAIEKHLNKFIYSDSDIIENLSYSEINNYLLNTLLRDTDVMSMANGLELRPVFLNHDLVEYALALPIYTKLQNGKQKLILRDAMKDLIPSEYLNFGKKGFEVPIYDWMYKCFKNDILKSVNSKEIAAVFNKKFIRKVKSDVEFERNNKFVWILFIFQNWLVQNQCKFSVSE